MIGAYNTDIQDLLDFYKINSKLIEINSDQPMDKTLKQVNAHIEPTILHVRPNPDLVDLKNEIVHSLVEE